MLPYVEKMSLQMQLMGHYPGLLGWALDEITSVLIRESERLYTDRKFKKAI